jgi:ribosomal RNA assembly protein
MEEATRASLRINFVHFGVRLHQILIPTKRAELLKDKKLFAEIRKRLGCRIEVREGNELVIDGDALSEYNARIVIQAFARGFEFETACKLLGDERFFESIDMKQLFKNEEQIKRVKARVIGSDGKTKTYVQNVSGADLAIYGDTVSMIGTVDEIKIARAAIDVLLEGGTHKKAYAIMEKAKRRLKEGM